MVKRVLGRVNKVERGLFKLFRGSIAARQNQRMEYLRVFSPCLDRGKRWYVFYSKLTNLKPSKFSKRALFENFPEEVRKVRASLLTKPIVIDFGKCRLSSNPKRYDLSDVQKALYRRKHSWIAPELIQGTHSQSPASDVYSLGVLLQNMLSKFVQQSYCLESLATRCLARYPESRITLSKLKKEL